VVGGRTTESASFLFYFVTEKQTNARPLPFTALQNSKKEEDFFAYFYSFSFCSFVQQSGSLLYKRKRV
jgi:hypothetical protein